MRLGKFISAIYLFLSLAGTASASDNCGLTLTVNNVAINWTLSFSAIAVQITLQKANNPACDFWLGFSKGGAATAATRRLSTGVSTLRYQLYREASLTNILQDNSDGAIPNAINVIRGGFPEGTNLTQALTYYLDIPYGFATAPTLVRSGTYTDTFTINIYEGADPTVAGAVPVPRPANVTITTTVSPMIGISLVSTGGPYDAAKTIKTAAFGLLYQGATYTFDARIRTNAGFSVTFSSLNNGKLKSQVAGSTSTVPYFFFANGVLLNLNNSNAVPVTGLSGPGQTTMDGLAYPLRIVVGAIGGSAMGGSYADSVSITATTTE